MKYVFLLLLFFPGFVLSQQIIVDPYLQNAEPTSITISWETSSVDQGIVDWGTDSLLLPNQNTGVFVASSGQARIHHVNISTLQPATTYYYRVRTASVISDTFHFQTPPLPSAEASTTIIASSDMQKDGGNPNKWDEIVHAGIIDYVQSNYGNDLAGEIAFMLIPGDLVPVGTAYSQWKNDFFDPAHPLFSYVPVYPVLGNHEVNASHYFNYFELPKNGTVGFEEHWWFKDYSNIRIIGLNSNSPFATQTQLNWLDSLLIATCSNPDIDFVFAQLHHPHHSELWPPGELNFTGDVIELLETFSSNCGKPSIHFYGHTHGYSRGQSRDHSHLMVNVATGGGNIDYWGEYGQIDYEEYTKSQDEYGFVVIDVSAGADPKFTLKRISRGDEIQTLANALRDSITVYKNNLAPQQPVAQFPMNQIVSPDCILLQANAYSESEGDLHMASHWQVSNDCQDFSNPLHESFKTHENWYFEVNTQANDDLTDELVVGLPANTGLCWRVRFRDHSLGWSAWSAPASFTTDVSALGSNLLLNNGAEADTADWTVTAGFLEALTSGQCAGTSPHAGQKYFAVGALCNEAAYGEAYQQIDLSAYAADIDTGTVNIHYGGWLSNWNGSDVPEFRLLFLDGANAILDSTSKVANSASSWTIYDRIDNVPSGTRAVRFVIMGTRNSGSDNDSYFDDLYLRLNLNGCNNVITARETPMRRLPRLTVSPNPATDIARVEIAGMSDQSWEMLLFDTNGRVVRKMTGAPGEEMLLKVSGLAAGVYQLKVKAENKTWIKKVMVAE